MPDIRSFGVLLFVAARLLLAPPADPALAQAGSAQTGPAMTSSTKPTAAEAEAFVQKAEAELARESEYLGRVQWVQNTYITDDTNWLAAKANGESTALSVRYAKEAARFDGVTVDPVVRRKLELM